MKGPMRWPFFTFINPPSIIFFFPFTEHKSTTAHAWGDPILIHATIWISSGLSQPLASGRGVTLIPTERLTLEGCTGNIICTAHSLPPNTPPGVYPVHFSAASVRSDGAIFTGWSGMACGAYQQCSLLDGCNGLGDCIFTPSFYRTNYIYANYSLPPVSRTLTVYKTGTGNGTAISSPAGVNCGSDCSESYPNGTSVTMSATAAIGSVFAGWSITGCSGTDPCTLSMDADLSVTASFERQGCTGLTVQVYDSSWPVGTGGDTDVTVTAEVSEPAPPGGCEVDFEKPEPLAASGGHLHHDETRPHGSLYLDNCTIGEGLTFCVNTYSSSEVAGEEIIKATLRDTGETATGTMRVLVPGLSPLAVSDQHLLAGRFGDPGVTSQHTDNHNGTGTTLTLLQAMAGDYRGIIGNRLCVNDLSLTWGGLFDIGNNWMAAHDLHRVGKSVDFNTHAECSSIAPPPVDQKELARAASRWGASRIPEGELIHYEFP